MFAREAFTRPSSYEYLGLTIPPAVLAHTNEVIEQGPGAAAHEFGSGPSAKSRRASVRSAWWGRSGPDLLTLSFCILTHSGPRPELSSGTLRLVIDCRRVSEWR